MGRKMARPKVAIGVPVFNGEDHIESVIQCLKNQTFQDFEVLISDNCSTDRTVEICEKLIRDDGRFTLVQQTENLGAIPNFNYVARHTDSEYFKWAAADDLIGPTFLEDCIRILDSQPDVGVCYCKSDFVDTEGHSWLERIPESHHTLEKDHEGAVWWSGHPRQNGSSSEPIRRFQGVILGTSSAADSFGLIRRDVLNKTRLVVPHYGGEKVFLAELYLYAKHHYIDKTMFFQRLHADASSNIDDAAAEESFVVAQQKSGAPTRLALFAAHIYSIWRSDLPASLKVSGFLAIFRYAMQFRKWSSAFKQILFRKNIGGSARVITDVASTKTD